MAEPLTDEDYLEAHILAQMLADDPGNPSLQEAAWRLINRLRDEGKLPEPLPPAQ